MTNSDRTTDNHSYNDSGSLRRRYDELQRRYADLQEASVSNAFHDDLVRRSRRDSSYRSNSSSSNRGRERDQREQWPRHPPQRRSCDYRETLSSNNVHDDRDGGHRERHNQYHANFRSDRSSSNRGRERDQGEHWPRHTSQRRSRDCRETLSSNNVHNDRDGGHRERHNQYHTNFRSDRSSSNRGRGLDWREQGRPNEENQLSSRRGTLNWQPPISRGNRNDNTTTPRHVDTNDPIMERSSNSSNSSLFQFPKKRNNNFDAASSSHTSTSNASPVRKRNKRNAASSSYTSPSTSNVGNRHSYDDSDEKKNGNMKHSDSNDDRTKASGNRDGREIGKDGKRSISATNGSALVSRSTMAAPEPLKTPIQSSNINNTTYTTDHSNWPTNNSRRLHQNMAVFSGKHNNSAWRNANRTIGMSDIYYYNTAKKIK